MRLSKFAFLPLGMALAFSSSVVFAENVIDLEGIEVNKHLCKIEVAADNQDPNLKLSTHEVDKYLDSSWTELYTDGNWFDAKATIQNMSSNPGDIDIKVEAFDGFTSSTLYSTYGVDAGHSWTTGGISHNYKDYTVYVRASNNSGTYTLRYWDNPA